MTQKTTLSLQIDPSVKELLDSEEGTAGFLYTESRDLEKRILLRSKQSLAESLTVELRTRHHALAPVLSGNPFNVGVLPSVEEHRGSLYLHLTFDPASSNQYVGPGTLTGTLKPRVLYKPTPHCTVGEDARRFLSERTSILEEAVELWEAHVAQFVKVLGWMTPVVEELSSDFSEFEGYNRSTLRSALALPELEWDICYAYNMNTSSPVGVFVRLSPTSQWMNVLWTDEHRFSSDDFYKRLRHRLVSLLKEFIRHNGIFTKTRHRVDAALVEAHQMDPIPSSECLTLHLSDSPDGNALVLRYPTTDDPTTHADLYLDGDESSVLAFQRFHRVSELFDVVDSDVRRQVLEMTWVEPDLLPEGVSFDRERGLLSKAIDRKDLETLFDAIYDAS